MYSLVQKTYQVLILSQHKITVVYPKAGSNMVDFTQDIVSTQDAHTQKLEAGAP